MYAVTAIMFVSNILWLGKKKKLKTLNCCNYCQTAERLDSDGEV